MLRFASHRQPHPRPKRPKMPVTYPQATKLLTSASSGPVRPFSSTIRLPTTGINNNYDRISPLPLPSHGIDGTVRGPAEIFKRKKPISASLVKEYLLPHFATASLAFDGFSPESARRPHTLNLLRASAKWPKLESTL